MKPLITFVLMLLFCLSAHAQVPTAKEVARMYEDTRRGVESCAVIYRQKPHVREIRAIARDPRDKWFAELHECIERVRGSSLLFMLQVIQVLNEEDRQVPSRDVAELVSALWHFQGRLGHLQEEAWKGALEMLFDNSLFLMRQDREKATKAFRAYASASDRALQACGASASLEFQARKRHEAELLRALKSIEQSLSIRVGQEWLRYFQGR